MNIRFFLFFLLVVSSTFAQDDLLNELTAEAEEEKDTLVYATFKSPYLINAQTIEMVKRKTLDFRITHRFGDIAGGGGGGHTLFGFDVAENIRFSFDYGVTDRLTVGFGRSKTNEHIDGSIKYKLLSQTNNKTMPVSVVYYGNTAFTPRRNTDGFFDQPLHRFSFVNQLVIARKFSSKFSLGILPTIFHRNLVWNEINPSNNQADENTFFALGGIGRYKVTPRVAIVGEYFYVFSEYRNSNTLHPYYNHLGLGVEIETGGHVFHINLTNSSGIIPNDFLAESPDRWMDGQFKLGFNISRVFNW